MTVPRDIWERLIEGAAVTNTAAGDAIYRAGEVPRPTAVLSGTVRVFLFTTAGRQVTIRFAGPGELIGLAGYLTSNETSEAHAVTDVRAAILSVDHIHEMGRDEPEILWALARDAATSAVDALKRMADATTEPLTVRVAQHLLDLATAAPDGSIVAPVSHQVLAEATGTAREVVTRTLRGFRTQGLVETRKGRIVITDPARLTRVATRSAHQQGPLETDIS
ncbi:MAG TPA: Crp/Fnr family transcriptional regulator [Candidatus Acidoferrales bacterium]|jgi:CRP/FNR family cyclic AMP-dependent transcriptional regulator|nr:Crp/Fnr family transcriptional regulator [Candidatus Acidoferrales bacterium]